MWNKKVSAEVINVTDESKGKLAHIGVGAVHVVPRSAKTTREYPSVGRIPPQKDPSEILDIQN